MDDLISRQKTMDEMSKQQTYKMFVGEDTVYLDANDVGSVLASLPSAQSERRGQWEVYQLAELGQAWTVQCSVCHAIGFHGKTPYCCECGARMYEGKNHEQI